MTTGRGRDEANGGSGEDLLVMDWSAIDDPLAGIVHRAEGFGWASFAARSGDRLDYAGFERFDLSGGAGADHLVGGDLADTLSGGAGEDTLDSRGGGGAIAGGAGDDLWIARLGDIDAPVVFDARQSQNRPQGRKADLAVRDVEAVDIETGAGRDRISTKGYALDDMIKTGAGNDRIDPGLGWNEVNGGEGRDILTVNMSSAERAVTVVPIGFGWYRIADEGGEGRTEFTGIERFVFIGGTADDALIGGADNDRLVGGAGNDTLEGVAGRDVIDGKAGEDTWIADYGAESGGLALALNGAGNGRLGGVGTRLKSVENVDLSTGEGADRIDLSRGTGDDRVRTGEGDDAVDVGRGHRETAAGGEGEDVLGASAALAGAGVRTAPAGFGWWTMEARDGSYDLDYQGFERVSLAGSAHNDRLTGFDEADTLSGGEGRDILDGGEGDDLLTGGAEGDLFRFSRPGEAGIDTITDAGGGDRLRLAGLELTGPVRTGGAGNLLEGEVAADIRADRTTIGIGLDDTPGADFAVVLLGSYALADFRVDGGDLLVG